MLHACRASDDIKGDSFLLTRVLHACRASDDIEGDLGQRLDACMGSALSQCWGGPAIQFLNQPDRSKPASSDNPSGQSHEPAGAPHVGSDQHS